MDLQSEDQNSNLGRTFSTISFHRGCRLELTVLAEKETTRRKKIRKGAVNKIVSHDHKTQQQKRLTLYRHLLDHSRFYGVMVSNLDAESKDPRFYFGKIFL